MDLASALTTEGPLQKQSPGVFKVFQTRYFAIRGKGDYVVWYKKKPVNPDQNPKGLIKIQQITDIVAEDSDQRLFSIVYLQRTFNLRAESGAVKTRWVNALRTVLAHHKKLNKNKVKQQEQAAESWKWKNNQNKQITQKIRLENEQAILQDTDNSKGKQSQMFLAEITKQKNLSQIQKCIVYGYFTKKKLIGSSGRWFFLASGVNLKDQKDQQFYTVTQQLLQSLAAPVQKQPKPQQSPTRSKYDDSSDESEQEGAKKQQKKKEQLKNLKINILFEYDPQTKQIKHIYNLIDIVTFEMKSDGQPFEIRISYEEVVNEQQQQIKQQQITLTSQFLIEIKKLYTALKIINQKYNMQKQREEKNANKSKRYPAKKWKYINEDQWRIPQEKASLYVLLNKRAMRINMLTINLQQITEHKKQSLTITQVKNEEDQKFSKKQDALLVVYKKENEEYKIYIQFDKMETMVKFMKKLSKNIKKQQQQIQAQNAAKITNRKQEQKKTNPQTYLIDKRIRQTQTSIKVNFYELMDRQVIVEKKQNNGNENKGLWDKFMAMFCSGPAAFDVMS